MAQKVYKLYMFKPTEAWYQLSEKEKNKYRTKVRETVGKVGGKEIIACFSGWNSEQWLGWGVEEFPSIEAAQKHHALLVAFDWFRFCESNSFLGTEIPRS